MGEFYFTRYFLFSSTVRFFWFLFSAESRFFGSARSENCGVFYGIRWGLHFLYADTVCGLFAFFHCDASCGSDFYDAKFILVSMISREIFFRQQFSILNLFLAVEF